MTKQKEYDPPGSEDQTVGWAYCVAFKKPRGKRLWWVHTYAKTIAKASRDANKYIEERRPNEGFREYGTSKTYWRNWRDGWKQQITKDDYERARARARAR